MIGLVAGIDNIAAALSMGALLFAGPIASGMGLGVGVVLLGGSLMAAIIALTSKLRNSIGLVQETTIAIIAAAIIGMTLKSTGNADTKVATAVAMIGVSSLVTGALFWITGRLKIGDMVRFLPYPVVAGFLAGSGLLLVDGALILLTGRSLGPEFPGVFSESAELWRLGPAVLFGITLHLVLGRFNHPAAMPFVMLVSVALFYYALSVVNMPVETARSLGHLPQMNTSGGIELPTIDLVYKVDWWLVINSWPTFLAIAGLSMVGLMLNISGLELALGKDLDVNAELRSTGFANMGSGVVGGPSGFVGLSMTLLADKFGVDGRSAGIATVAVMLLGLFSAGSLIFQVPVFLTGGFVLYLGAQLLKEWFIDTQNKLPRSKWLIVGVILLSIALIGFMEGLAVGLLASSAVFVFKYSRLPVIRLHATGVERRSTVDRSPSDIKFLSEHGQCIEVVQLQGYLFFGTADRVVDLVRRRLADSSLGKLRFIILDFKNVSGADSAAITCFQKIQTLVEGEDVKVFFSDVPDELCQHFSIAGMMFGVDQIMALHTDLDHALEKAEEMILGEQTGSDESNDLINHLSATIGPHPRLAEFIETMTRLEMEREDLLIRQGEEANDIFFLAAGRVRVQISLPNGNMLRVRTMLPGAVVGEIAFFLNQTRSADVVIDAPSVVFRLSAEDLVRLESEDAELAAIAHRILATNLSEKLAVANKMIQLTQS